MSTTCEPPSGVIVVGVDGSETSVAALVWALRVAVRDQADIEVLTVWPEHQAAFIHEVPGHFSDARNQAVEAQARAVEHASRAVEPLPAITTRIENADPAEALVQASRSAARLVLGAGSRPDRRDAGTPSALVRRCVNEARCDVTVVDGDATDVAIRPVPAA